MEEFKWEVSNDQTQKPIRDGDLRLVKLEVQCIFEWSDEIVSDYDYESDTTEYTSGYVMKVLPNQKFVYKNNETVFYASTFSNKKPSN